MRINVIVENEGAGVRPPQRPRSSRARAPSRATRAAIARPRARWRRPNPGEAAHGDEGAPSRRAAPRDPPSRGTPAPSAPSLTPPSSPPVRAGPVRSAGEERRRGRPRVEPGTRDANGAPHAASPRPRLPSPPLPLARRSPRSRPPTRRPSSRPFPRGAELLRLQGEGPGGVGQPHLAKQAPAHGPPGATTDEPPPSPSARPPLGALTLPPLPPSCDLTPFPSSTGGSRQGVDVPGSARAPAGHPPGAPEADQRRADGDGGGGRTPDRLPGRGRGAGARDDASASQETLYALAESVSAHLRGLGDALHGIAPAAAGADLDGDGGGDEGFGASKTTEALRAHLRTLHSLEQKIGHASAALR